MRESNQTRISNCVILGILPKISKPHREEEEREGRRERGRRKEGKKEGREGSKPDNGNL